MSTAFRPFDPFQVFTDQHGELATGGQLVFFTTGTTTPKSVFADMGLTVNLGNSIGIGTDGRPSVGGSPTDIWGTDAYRVRLLDANGVQIGPDRDNVAIPGGGAAALPTPFIANALLTNDGALAEWITTILMPDPTGHANDILGTDGTAVFWQTLASLGIPTVSAVAANGFVVGSVRIQWGTVTLPASGASVTSQAATFGTAFSGAPYAVVPVNYSGSGATISGRMVILSAQGVSSTGFTMTGDLNNAPTGSPPPISNPTNCGYIAFGPA